MGGSPFQLTDLHPGRSQMLPCGEAAGLCDGRAPCGTLSVTGGLCHRCVAQGAAATVLGLTPSLPCAPASAEQCGSVMGIHLCLLQGLIVEIPWICMSLGGKPYVLPVAM